MPLRRTVCRWGNPTEAKFQIREPGPDGRFAGLLIDTRWRSVDALMVAC